MSTVETVYTDCSLVDAWVIFFQCGILLAKDDYNYKSLLTSRIKRKEEKKTTRAHVHIFSFNSIH